MKKVLLVSLVGTENFGNRLQQYALQRIIEGYGFAVDLLKIGDPTYKTIAKWILKEYHIIIGDKKYRAQEARSIKFLSARENFYKNLLFVPANRVFSTDWDEYECVVAGSDQIWHNGNKYTYLEFVDESKRISYAPSFGFSSFSEKDIDEHRRGLMGIKELSCRELEGCNLIYELTGRKAQKVLDPTLLLTKEEWINIEKEPSFAVSKEYLLLNIMGTLLPEYMAEIERISNERSLQIININDITDITHYAISPDEFIWLVHHADTICTDSFHTSVFSILFEKNLRVYRRQQKIYNDMFGRLHDLLEPLGLMDLVYGEGQGMSTVLNETATKYLDEERKTSFLYLRKSLGIE